MIEPIVKLAALVMVIDNDADESEMSLFQDIPTRMIEHLEDRAGVNIVAKIRVGGLRSVKSKGELDEESEHVRNAQEMADLANQTIKAYNEIDEDRVDDWVIEIASEINGKWVRFHTIKLLVDIAAADEELHSDELHMLSVVAEHWDCVDDVLDFLYLKSRTEWILANGKFKNTKKS